MTMEMEDLQNKMRDIQMMKVTREIQTVSFDIFVTFRVVGELCQNPHAQNSE